jgi:hypothetical protein
VQNQYFLFYAPSTPGTFTYIVTLNASCDDRACPPCTMPFTLNVIEGPPCTCSDWGWTSVSWGDGPGQFSGVQNGISIGTGTINPGTEIKIIPYDLGCNGCGFPRPNFSWSITAYGQPIADGQCLQQDLPIIFTPPDTIGQVTYVVTLGAECKDTICPQQIFSILVSMNRASTALLAPVITSFTASRTQVAPGETVMLYWTITGSGDAFLTCGGERRSVPLTGSMAVTPPQSGCCTLTVSNQAGSDQKTVCITVLAPREPAPVINSFTARCPQPNPAARVPATCTLSWSVTGPAGTTVSISGIGNVSLSGSTQVPRGGVYTLMATSSGGSVSRIVQAQ